MTGIEDNMTRYFSDENGNNYPFKSRKLMVVTETEISWLERI